MKIVIDIPDTQYEYLAKIATVGEEPLGYFERVIMRDTPLPKRHGRLGDLDRVKAMVFNASMDEYFMPIKLLTCDDITDIISYIPTIIEGSDNNDT